MFSKKNLQHIATIFLIFIILFSTLTNKSLAQNSSAYNDVRNTTNKDCNEDTANPEKIDHDKTCYSSNYSPETGMCDKPEFKFDPFGDNVDREWSLTNEACLGYIYGAGMTLQGVFAINRTTCPLPALFPQKIDKTNFKQALASIASSRTDDIISGVRHSASAASSQTQYALAGMPLDPMLLVDLGVFFARCVTAIDPATKSTCCIAFGVCNAALLAAVSALAIIWDTAEDNFKSTVICGNGWRAFKRDITVGSDTIGQWKTIDGNYAICLKQIFKGGTSYCAPGDNCDETASKPKCALIKNKSQEQYCKFTNGNNNCSGGSVGELNALKDYTNIHYRQFIFNGIEYIDNGSNACKNPTDPNWKTILGYHPTLEGENQRYYFLGPNQTPNFACQRFLDNGLGDKDGMKAYACCKEKSQNTTCLERFDSTKKDYKYCRIGGGCETNLHKHGLPVKYRIFESEKNKNYICAQTYSVCPYDHNVQGGTDKVQNYYYNPRIISNFCQYMNHCIKLAPLSEYSHFDRETFFFAESCKNLRGDSQFFSDMELGRMSKFSSMYSRNFSAPIVQCFKETLENNFMQKVGQTICKSKDEVPKKTKTNPDGYCASGYTQTKGAVVDQTFFTKVQKRFLIPIKIALVLSVVMFGFNILLATPEAFINKKTVMTYLIKFGLVYFFVIGNAWQGFFMDSVMNVSSEFAKITFSPKSTIDTDSGDDGCIFPRYNYSSLLEPNLKPEQDKTARQGEINKIKTSPSYPPGKNYLRIWDTLDCKIARAIGYGPNVSVPNLAKMIFAGFLSGSLGIMFFFAAFAYGLMLISIAMRAIHITIMSIMGVILLIYVSPLTITCALFERTKGIFENWWKQMLGFILQPMILFAYLGLMLTVFDDLFIGDAKFNPPLNGELPTIDCARDAIIKSHPDENSIYCILQLERYKSYTGLEVFDLAIPVLMSMNKEKINTLTRAAIIMFVFLKFLDTITTVAKKLVGGAELKANSTSEIQNLLKKVAKGVQKRALNATTNIIGKQIPNYAKKKLRSNESPPPKMDGGAKDNKTSSSPSDFAGGSKDTNPQE